jgi:hypothetical protein
MYLEHLLDGEVAVGDVPLLDGDWRVEPGHRRHLHQLAQIVTVLEATTALCFLHARLSSSSSARVVVCYVVNQAVEAPEVPADV